IIYSTLGPPVEPTAKISKLAQTYYCRNGWGGVVLEVGSTGYIHALIPLTLSNTPNALLPGFL
ncbi:hypothetical protein GE21DRAFT_1211556, partial [Neurospora crassa]